MLRTISGFKDGLVQKQSPIVVEAIDWQEQAQQIAKHGLEFEYHGFNFGRDLGAATEIASQNKLELSFDPGRRIAFFRKE